MKDTQEIKYRTRTISLKNFIYKSETYVFPLQNLIKNDVYDFVQVPSHPSKNAPRCRN